MKCKRLSGIAFESFTKEINIADADGKTIVEGSVLKRIDDGTTGVVKMIIREGDRASRFTCVGDLIIQTSPGVEIVTNYYDQWRHVPRVEQTYRQRYESWRHSTADNPFESEDNTKEENNAVFGLMSLFPTDPVDWEYGPWPDSFESALKFMAEHLESLVENQKGGEK